MARLTDEQLATLRASNTPPNRVRLAYKLAGVTQEKIAAATDLSQKDVSVIVNGHYRRLPLENARSLAEYFGCAIEDLFPKQAA